MDGRRRRRVLIMGAAGRDFHNFNVRYRSDASAEVVAFTATQIPGIEGRRYPAALAGEHYPGGIPIYPQDELDKLIAQLDVDEVVFAYSDVSHITVMNLASRVLAAGADFALLGPRSTMLASARPVVSVCAVRTGAGKSQTTRAVTRILAGAGLKLAVVRHPMPYGDIAAQAVQRFGSLEDLDAADPTIEEREEYEPHLAQGSVVFAGVDYEEILRAAEAEADVIVWDGGNNDLPFYEPTVHIVVADPLRVGHETSYHPGEANLRMADVVVINKTDSAAPDDVTALEESVAALNPGATVVRAASPITLDGDVSGRRVVVVEDGPTLTHGEMAYGAGVVAARRAGAELVDPRPWAVGSIRQVFERYPHIGPLVPAMGYSAAQRRELEQTLNAAEADVVLVATPIDLRRVLSLDKPALRVRYELADAGRPTLAEALKERLPILA